MYVEGHHPREPLQDLAQAIPQKRIWRRFPALILAMQGRTAQDLARGWACSRRAGKNGGVPDNRGGVTALQERPHPGRPPRRAPDHDSGGKQRRDDPPRPEDGVCTWRGRDGPRVLEQEFGVRWGLPAVSDLLHRRDYRRRMPRPQHEPANPAVPEFFPESVVAPSDALAAADPDTAVRLAFEDEARFGPQGTIPRVWTPKGSRPRAGRPTRSTFLFVLVAVAVSPGEASALLRPELNAAVVNLFREQFARERPAGVQAVLIWEGAGSHLSVDRKVPSKGSLIWLPPDSPEWNPVENLWHFLRAHHWSNRPDRDYKDLENEAVRSMRKVCLDDKENLKNICNAPYVMKRA